MSEEIDTSDLQRYDAICDALYDERSAPSESQIIEALNDKYVSIRAEALDYLIQLAAFSDGLNAAIRHRYSAEDSEQCIGRLILLADRLGDDPSFTALPAELSRFEIDYLAIWSSIALAIQPSGCLTIALSYTFHPDHALSELARNLLLEYCLDEHQLADRREMLMTGPH